MFQHILAFYHGAMLMSLLIDAIRTYRNACRLNEKKGDPNIVICADAIVRIAGIIILNVVLWYGGWFRDFS